MSRHGPVPALRSRLHPGQGRLAAALAVLTVLVCAVWVVLDILACQNVWSNSGQDLVAGVSLATGAGPNRVRLSCLGPAARAGALARLKATVGQLAPRDFAWEGEVICAVARAA